ncbi:MAG: hypothetical protein ACPGVB_08165 [Chitinophagales bacterium]
MLVANQPVGRFIVMVNVKKDLEAKDSIREKSAILIDLMKIRIKHQTIEDVANSLLENIYDLRIEAVKLMMENGGMVKVLFEFINKQTAKKLQLAPYSKLAEAQSKILMAYEKIAAPILKNIAESLGEVSMLEELKENAPQYKTMKFYSHISPEMDYVKRCIDASLQFEFGLILSDLVLTEEIDLPLQRVKTELIDFLYDSITRFGAYSMLCNLWTPKYEDISNLTNRMKILSATVDLDSKGHKSRMSMDDFSKILNN